MDIAKQPVLLPLVDSHSKGYLLRPIDKVLEEQNYLNSMSQDYHHQAGIFSFSNGFDRSSQQEQHHIVQQIRRDKLRVEGFEPPPPLVAIEEEAGGYETVGMLSEMFSFQPGDPTATELLEHQMSNYRNTRNSPAGVNTDLYGNRQGMMVGDPKNHQNSLMNNNERDSIATAHHHHHQMSSIYADSAAAAMQLFLMNPQPRSPSPSPSAAAATSSTLHMLLPNPSSTSTLQGFHNSSAFAPSQFTWLPPGTSHEQGGIPGEVASQGLSLSLSSSLQHLEAAKDEELSMGDGGMLYFNQGVGGGEGSNSAHFQFKNLGSHHQALQLQGGVLSPNNQVHVGFGSSSLGVVNVLRNSKYVKAAQELLEEFCSVGRGHFKKNKFGKPNINPNSNPTAGSSSAGGGGGGSSSSSKDLPTLSGADRIEHQRRKVKLISMLDEVDRRYNHYCEQMQMVVNSFDLVMGFGAAVPYTALAQKAMSRHFRCLKDAIAAQLKHSCELLGEKDAGTSGVTKGETPRLKLLEQSLRQQRAFHQMGMMEQEAWRPQRGLPERSVNILRAWLFEHFLHPYPSDADKHLLARQTGLSRNQVSNWFINARVRLWKPMVEEMYQQEGKEEEREINQEIAQTPMPNTTITTTTTAATTATTTTTTGKRSEINVTESDHSLIAINRQCFSENEAKMGYTSSTAIMPTFGATATAAATTTTTTMEYPDYGTTSTATTTTSGNADIGSTLIRFGTSAGDVSLTLGLRHSGNLPEKSPFSVRDFGGC